VEGGGKTEKKSKQKGFEKKIHASDNMCVYTQSNITNITSVLYLKHTLFTIHIFPLRRGRGEKIVSDNSKCIRIFPVVVP
jgi:hypothetical protein